jgi:hypothetical protein
VDAADLPVRKLRLWRSLWFRRLAWWIARRCGIVWSWLTTDWGGVALWLAAVIVLMWLHARLIGSPIRFTDFLTPELALKVLVLTALLWLFHWAYQARRRLVIQTFANFTGDDKLKQYIEGLAPRLLNEIASLNTLYEIIDEARPQTSSEGGIQATVSVLDVGETLKESVTADSKVSLWGLQIPIGAVLGTVGRLAQGPRLAASLHRVGDKPCLIANISGGGSRGGSWQVRFEDLFDRHATAEANATDVTDRTGTPRTEGSGRHNDRPSAKSDSQHLDGASTQSEAMFDDPAKFTETVERMIEQLAYRVFTDFVRVGSRRWRAVCSYSAGLRAYRETQRTMRAKALNLRKAERAFIQALAEDTTFAQCHYNLGIVYKDLGKEQSAAMSFRRAVEEDPCAGVELLQSTIV